MKSVISSLHQKVQTIQREKVEIQRSQEEIVNNLRHTIAEMQTAHERALNELRNRMQQKGERIQLFG